MRSDRPKIAKAATWRPPNLFCPDHNPWPEYIRAPEHVQLSERQTDSCEGWRRRVIQPVLQQWRSLWLQVARIAQPYLRYGTLGGFMRQPSTRSTAVP